MISFVTVGVKVMETVVMHRFAGGIGWMGGKGDCICEFTCLLIELFGWGGDYFVCIVCDPVGPADCSSHDDCFV